MGRVHGECIISRRKNIKQKSRHNYYKKELQEDFYHLCGYCGKLDIAVKEDFQIDHFVPKNIDPSRKNDYYNLVYSCRICNRNKWDKWPTNNKDIDNDGKVGFVDPASREFDKHLSRRVNGEIYYNSELGKYMFDELKMGTRPIALVWKLMRLKKLEGELRKKIKDESRKDLHSKYFEVSSELNDIVDFLYLRR